MSRERSIDRIFLRGGGIRWFIHLAIPGFLLAFCVRLAASVDFRAVLEMVRGAPASLLGLALVAHAAVPPCKVMRWRLILRESRVTFLRLIHYYLVGDAAATFIPGRFGEALWIWLLASREGISAVTSVAALTVDKLFEGSVLAGVAAITPLLLPLPARLVAKLETVLLVAVLAVVAALTLARGESVRLFASRWRPLAKIVEAFAVIRIPSAMLGCICWSLIERALEGVAVFALFRAAGIHAPWAAAGLVMVAQSLALVFPVTPGQVGALEISSVAPLLLLGIAREQALAFALLYRAIQLVTPLMGTALAVPLVRFVRTTSSDDAAAAASQAPESGPLVRE